MMKRLLTSRVRAESGATAAGLLLSLMVVAIVLVLGIQMLTLAAHDQGQFKEQADDYAAGQLAELGAARAMTLLRIIPTWPLGDSPNLESPVNAEGLNGSYQVTVSQTGEVAGDGYPVIRVESVGQVGPTTSTAEARVYLVPPPFFRGALGMYGSYIRNGPTVVDGDVYVQGEFKITAGGASSIDGTLVAESYSGINPNEVSGGIYELSEDTFRERPQHPWEWYVWAQDMLYRIMYQEAVPSADAGSAPSFAAMLAEAAKTDQYPHGVMYLVDGDYTISGGPHTVNGRLTLVVRGKLTVDTSEILYQSQDYGHHLALISLGGVAWAPSRRGPYEMFVYTYEDEWEGRDPKVTPAAEPGVITVSSNLNQGLTGFIGGKEVQGSSGNWYLYHDDERFRQSPAPGIPGFRVHILDWNFGGGPAPGGSPPEPPAPPPDGGSGDPPGDEPGDAPDGEPDDTPPVVTFTPASGNLGGGTVTVTATDDGSGMQSAEYQWVWQSGPPDPGKWVFFAAASGGQTSKPPAPPNGSQWWLHVQVTDNAGNETVTSSGSYKP